MCGSPSIAVTPVGLLIFSIFHSVFVYLAAVRGLQTPPPVSPKPEREKGSGLLTKVLTH